MLTYRLNDGAVVLARLHRGQPEPVRYANLAQAERKAREIGGEVLWRPYRSRVYYVRLLTD